MANEEEEVEQRRQEVMGTQNHEGTSESEDVAHREG